jgi:hypothetical protein
LVPNDNRDWFQMKNGKWQMINGKSAFRFRSSQLESRERKVVCPTLRMPGVVSYQ